MSSTPDAEKVQTSIIQKLRAWGEHSVPPTALATLIASQHMQPFQALPMIFPPILLGCSYLNLNDFKADAAGLSAAWSGLYMILARRRKQAFVSKLSLRGVVRGGTLAMCAANVVGGGVAYYYGKKDERESAK